jgi:tetratricopeptide (TPR) repeat protein
MLLVFAGCNDSKSPAPTLPTEPVSSAPASVPSTRVATPEPARSIRYAGSERCAACHEKAYSEWKTSHHARAERPIDPDEDRAAFDPPREIVHGSIRSTVRERDGRFEIVTLDGAGAMSAHEPVRVLAEDPLRQFLIPAKGGRLQVTALAYDPNRGDWFDVYGDEDRRPHEWGFWTNGGMNWNMMCAGCHNTGLHKGYDPATDTYDTTFAEMGVGCEACHGPARAHVDWQQQYPGQSNDPTAPRIPAERAMDVCGGCHARREALTDGYVAPDRFGDHYLLALPDHRDIFYPDGQVREEDYEYTSFLLSRMHLKGVRCHDCHAHGGVRLIAEGNALCLRCHGVDAEPDRRLEHQIDPAAHAHHKLDSPGGQCVDCHMPITVYMQRDPRHDHGMTIPDPRMTAEFGIPNACNRCHTDKSVEWAIEATDKWYGEKMDRPTRKRTRIIARAHQGDASAVAQLASLARTEEHPGWRAVAVRMLERWATAPEVAGVLLDRLADEDALVRAEAAGALGPVASQVAPALAPRLEDDVRAVRIQAARALAAGLPLNSRAGRDLMTFLRVNADGPAGAMMYGTFHNERNNTAEAIAAFERAIRLEPNGVVQRHQLAVALSKAAEQAAQAKQHDRARQFRTRAIQELTVACEMAPEDAAMAYALGLACAEAGRMETAIASFQHALELDENFARAAYNLGLIYAQTGRPDDAIDALRQAGQTDPGNPDFPYALATVFAQLGRDAEAQEAAMRAIELNPDYTPAVDLLRQLDSRR